MYKEASKQQLRFQTAKGMLSVEQLWSLSLTDLDALAVSLQDAYENSRKKSFLEKTTSKDKTIKLRFDIVLDVLQTKVEEAAIATEAQEVKAHNQKILEIIANKKDESLKNKSLKELEAMLK